MYIFKDCLISKMKVCKVCGIVLSDKIRVSYNKSLMCKYCYREYNREQSRYYYSSTKQIVEKVTKNCVICNNEFTTNRKEKVVCSKECRIIHKRNTERNRIPLKKPGKCIICGTKLSNARLRLCSDECRKIRRRELEKMYQFKR